MHPVWSASQPNSIRALLIPSMQGIPWSVDRLAQFGIETFGLNLTPHFAVPAAHVIAPGLQRMPSEIITPRLADMIARRGGVRPIPMVSP
jgi:hypothetical protein